MLNKKPFIYLFLIAFIALVSCAGNTSEAQQNNGKNLSANQQKKLSIQGLKQYTAFQATENYGQPQKKETFDLSNPLSEFRVEIYNHIPQNKRISNLKILEHTRNYNTKENITIWYKQQQKQWVYLHHNIWPKDAVF